MATASSPVIMRHHVMKAVKDNDVSLLKTYLEGMSESYRQGILTTRIYSGPLCVAVSKGYSEICRILLSFGAKVNFRGLFKTVETYDASLFTTYLEETVNPQRRKLLQGLESCYRPPLCEAVCRGYSEICRILLSFGANVNLVGHFGQIMNENCTALQIAVYHGHGEIFNILVEAGADIDISFMYSNGHSLLGMAVYRNNFAIAQKLVSLGADPNYHGNPFLGSDTKDSMLPIKSWYLSSAIDHGNMKMVQLLVGAGAHLFGGWPARSAQTLGQTEIADFLNSVQKTRVKADNDIYEVNNYDNDDYEAEHSDNESDDALVDEDENDEATKDDDVFVINTENVNFMALGLKRKWKKVALQKFKKVCINKPVTVYETDDKNAKLARIHLKDINKFVFGYIHEYLDIEERFKFNGQLHKRGSFKITYQNDKNEIEYDTISEGDNTVQLVVENK